MGPIAWKMEKNPTLLMRILVAIRAEVLACGQKVRRLWGEWRRQNVVAQCGHDYLLNSIWSSLRAWKAGLDSIKVWYWGKFPPKDRILKLARIGIHNFVRNLDNRGRGGKFQQSTFSSWRPLRSGEKEIIVSRTSSKVLIFLGGTHFLRGSSKPLLRAWAIWRQNCGRWFSYFNCG